MDKIALNCQKVTKQVLKELILAKIWPKYMLHDSHYKNMNVILPLFLVFSAENSSLYPHRPEKSVWNKSEYWNPFTRLCQMYKSSYNYALRKKRQILNVNFW